MVAAGIADQMLVQLSYAIGVARPVSIFVDTYGTAKEGLTDSLIAEKIGEIFDLRPAKIIERFQLKNPIYLPTAAYGHMGRKPYRRSVTIIRDGKEMQKEVQFFGWELLDAVDTIKKAF
jgi:S-adenosylmethionine synthetase